MITYPNIAKLKSDNHKGVDHLATHKPGELTPAQRADFAAALAARKAG